MKVKRRFEKGIVAVNGGPHIVVVIATVINAFNDTAATASRKMRTNAANMNRTITL